MASGKANVELHNASLLMHSDNAQAVHGSSVLMKPDADLVAQGNFMDFAPAPCCLYGCLIPEALKKRTFLRAYDNHIETNSPFAPCLCICDDERYVVDQTWVGFFDKPPFRSGMACGCIPCTCCGPPVIFSHNPICCCIDMAPWYGSQIRAAPCSCFNMKKCYCCCNPCYIDCSIPIARGVSDPNHFLASLAKATQEYAKTHGIAKHEQVIYASVSDNVHDFGGSRAISSSAVMVRT